MGQSATSENLRAAVGWIASAAMVVLAAAAVGDQRYRSAVASGSSRTESKHAAGEHAWSSVKASAVKLGSV